MGLEAATYIHQLNPSNPVGAVDPKSQGDDHFRLLKSTIQASFPNITGAMVRTHTELNAVGASGVTGLAISSVDVDIAAPSAGAASTVLRSDARLRLSQAIAPNWSAQHTFSKNGTAANSAIKIDAPVNPFLAFRNSGEGADGKVWDFGSDTSHLLLRIVNDANTVAKNILDVGRTANVVTSVSFGNATDNPSYSFLGSGTFNVAGFAWFGLDNNAAGASVSIGTNITGSLAAANRGSLFVNGVNDSVVTLGKGEVAQAIFYSDGAEARISTQVNIPINFFTNGTNKASIAADGGIITNGVTGGSKGAGTINATELYSSGANIKSVPRSTTATTLAIGDLGKCVAVSAAINIPASVFASGDILSIYNDSAAPINITTSAGTLRLAGTATTGTRALAPRGLATLWFNVGGATPETICSGPGVS